MGRAVGLETCIILFTDKGIDLTSYYRFKHFPCVREILAYIVLPDPLPPS